MDQPKYLDPAKPITQAEMLELAEQLQKDSPVNPKRAPNYLHRVYPNLAKIKELISNGETDYSICEQLQVSKRQYTTYKKYPEMAELYYFNGIQLTQKVQHALFKKAIGFTHSSKKLGKDWKIVEVEEYFPPDTTAAIFWLTNRAPSDWKHRNALTKMSLTQNNQYNLEETKGKISSLMEELVQLKGKEDEKTKYIEETPGGQIDVTPETQAGSDLQD